MINYATFQKMPHDVCVCMHNPAGQTKIASSYMCRPRTPHVWLHVSRLVNSGAPVRCVTLSQAAIQGRQLYGEGPKHLIMLTLD